MELRAPLFLLVIFSCLSYAASGQQQPLVYNHFYFNPYLYNPSYIAPSGYTELFLNYRKQWSGIDGAPTTATVNLQVPFNYKAGFGVNLYNDEAGILRTTTGMISFAYSIYMGQRIENNHRISFGISVGATNSNIDITNADNPDDPALANNSTTYLDGQFGLNYQFKGLKIGFAIPRIFKSFVVSDESFNKPGIEQLKNTITSLSYNFNIGQSVSFEPFLLYRTVRDLPSQYEAMAILRYNNSVWVGGSYREEYGASAFLGFSVKGFKLGYAYEFATAQVDRIGDGTHEIQLAIKLGKRKERPQRELISEEEPAPVEPEETRQEEIVETQPEEKPETEQPIQPAVVTEEKKEPVETEPVTEQPKVEEPVAQPAEPVRQETVPSNQTDSPIKINGKKMPAGHYTVIGVFSSLQNAQQYRDWVKRAGYPADLGNYPAKNYYFVYVNRSADLEEARQIRNEFRKKSEFTFSEAWILSVE